MSETLDSELSARSPTLRLATRGPLFDCHNALRARLALAFPPRQFNHVAIPAKPSKATWDRVQSQPPFVGLCWLGLQPGDRNGRKFHCDADWLIYLGCRNQRPDQLLTGDTYGVGMLGLTGLGVALLQGWSERDLGTWTVKAVDNAALQEFIGEEIGVVALQVSCTLSLVDEEAAAALPEFLRAGAQWDLPPIGGEMVDNVRQVA